MASLFFTILFLYSALKSGYSLEPQTQHSVPILDGFTRKMQQTNSHAPLKVYLNGEPCVLLWYRRLSLKHREEQLDLTATPPDLSQSTCSKDQALMVLRFGDVKDLKDLSISLSLSSSEVEASGERWFSLDSVCVQFNSSQKIMFNSTQVYSPESASFSCEHISSLHKYNSLLSPTEHAQDWALTFTHFQIQAFSVSSGEFSGPVDCATFLTPALLMGLLCSLILLLVLVYAFHLLLHLRDMEEHQHHCQSKKQDCAAPKYVL